VGAQNEAAQQERHHAENRRSAGDRSAAGDRLSYSHHLRASGAVCDGVSVTLAMAKGP